MDAKLILTTIHEHAEIEQLKVRSIIPRVVAVARVVAHALRWRTHQADGCYHPIRSQQGACLRRLFRSMKPT